MLPSRQPPSPENSVTTSSKYPAFALRYIPGSAAAGCFANADRSTDAETIGADFLLHFATI